MSTIKPELSREEALNHVNSFIRYEAVKTYKDSLSDDELERALTDVNPGIRYLAVKHGRLNQAQKNRALKDEDHAIRQEAVMYGNFSQEEADLINADTCDHVKRRAYEVYNQITPAKKLIGGEI